ncbi:MAG: helix-turn-helix transcriptional regulator [Gammaproteobacteria bacterium]
MQKHPHLVLLGKRIRKLRTTRGFTQEGFAGECGLDRSYYGGVERGERNIAVLNLIKIAAALGVEVKHLLSGIKFPRKTKAKR